MWYTNNSVFRKRALLVVVIVGGMLFYSFNQRSNFSVSFQILTDTVDISTEGRFKYELTLVNQTKTKLIYCLDIVGYKDDIANAYYLDIYKRTANGRYVSLDLNFNIIRITSVL